MDDGQGDPGNISVSNSIQALRRFIGARVPFKCVPEQIIMPRLAIEDNSRLSLRIRPDQKALLMRAVSLEHADLTDFILKHAIRAAKKAVEDADHIYLSERDTQRVLALLENPPAPNAKLLAAACRLPQIYAENVTPHHLPTKLPT